MSDAPIRLPRTVLEGAQAIPPSLQLEDASGNAYPSHGSFLEEAQAGPPALEDRGWWPFFFALVALAAVTGSTLYAVLRVLYAPLLLVLLGLVGAGGCHTVPHAIVYGTAVLESDVNVLGGDLQLVLRGTATCPRCGSSWIPAATALGPDRVARDTQLVPAAEALAHGLTTWHVEHDAAPTNPGGK